MCRLSMDFFRARLADAQLEKKEHMPTSLKHAWSSNHYIYFKNSQVIDKGSFSILNIPESWHIASIDHADNNSRSLPNQDSILLKKEQLVY